MVLAVRRFECTAERSPMASMSAGAGTEAEMRMITNAERMHYRQADAVRCGSALT